MTSNNLLYYSTNTGLAHYINERFYKGTHYVWCSPVFNPATLSRYSPVSKIGTTSSPHDIYCDLKRVINTRDRHSSKIKDNRIGLKAGAALKLANGTITEEEFGEIVQLIDEAETAEFAPYIYVIRKDLVESRVKSVGAKETANPLGVEYRILDLKTSEFEIIEIDS